MAIVVEWIYVSQCIICNVSIFPLTTTVIVLFAVRCVLGIRKVALQVGFLLKTVLRYPLRSHFPIFPQPFFVLLSYGFSLWNFYSSPVLKEWLLPTPGTPSFTFCEVWSKIFKPLSSRLLDWCQLDTSPGEGNDGTPLQYSCLENPMDRGAW